MDALPNRYAELTDLQRAKIDVVINAMAAGRLVEDMGENFGSLGVPVGVGDFDLVDWL